MSTNIETNLVKTRQIDLSVTGMTCSSCVSTIERSLNKIPGVRAAVNLAMESAHVIAPLNISEKELISAVSSAGYQATAFKGERESFERSNRLGIRLLITFLLTAPVILISMFDSWHEQIDARLLSVVDSLNILLADNGQKYVISYPNAPITTWLLISLSIPVVFILAWPIHRSAVKNLTHPNMDTLVYLGSLV